MLFYLLLIASPFLITAFPHNSNESGEQKIIISCTGNGVPIVRCGGYQECIDNCVTTLEYNPVCGTDNVDYSNPGKLNCAKKCGKDVEIAYYGTCDSTNETK